MVPLDAERTVLDWMAALQIPLLLVVGGYLGTISHTLTALDVLAPRHLKVAAIVVSESERNPVELDDTVASIARFAHGVGVVGMPRLPGGLNSASGLCENRRAFITPASAPAISNPRRSRSCLRC